MIKPLPLLVIAALMVGCASEPEAEETQTVASARPFQVSCYQAGWQAETVPIVYKRGGPDAWDKYEFIPKVVEAGCR